MNKRLIWNFELAPTPVFELPKEADIEDAAVKWEIRFFWKEDEIIPLHGLDEGLLQLSKFEMKPKRDLYYLLNDSPYNLKLRREQLVYKPLIKKAGSLFGYGKKLKLSDLSPTALVVNDPPITAEALRDLCLHKGKQICVTKEALVYTFDSKPAVTMELARLGIDNQIYFSLCIESRAQTLVEALSNSLISKGISCDYVTFLKQVKS